MENDNKSQKDNNEDLISPPEEQKKKTDYQNSKIEPLDLNNKDADNLNLSNDNSSQNDENKESTAKIVEVEKASKDMGESKPADKTDFEDIADEIESEELEFDIKELCNQMIKRFRQNENQLQEIAKPDTKDTKLAYLNQFKPFFSNIQMLHKIEINKEREEFDKWYTEVEKWSEVYEKIFDELSEVIEKQSNFLEVLVDDELKNLPEAVKTALSNRKSGVNIIIRMFSRLPNRKKEFKENLLSFKENQEIKPILQKFIEEVTVDENMKNENIISTIERAAKELQDEFNAIRDHNYQVVREQREASDRIKKQTLTFLEQQLIPTVDGIDSGLQNEDEIRKPLKEFSEHKEIINIWFSVYNKMNDIMLDFFNLINIKKINVDIGEKFDETIHNAMSTEENPKMENETISSVIRSGYIIEDILVRAVDVEVVMND